ncbi:hypothetical protein [Pseudoalteromonas sp. R3]|uniref:hypothetical protein n=1 Tax=Pseudoalteromonas sp. R3 TaxID=1709477 RepID=UPI0006B51EF0|nr:hypothetical protein [Pseudoalteromonas sp. R3]AZZ97437.1 hypothetical protein ELR70_10090 [Pseudoalteromonas sp. R3]
MKILALLSTILVLSGCAGTSEVQNSNGCDVYTYFDKAQNNFSGLVYLDTDFERALTSQIPDFNESNAYCWYSKKNSLVGKLLVADYKPSIAYVFEHKSRGWTLVEINEVINLPAHQWYRLQRHPAKFIDIFWYAGRPRDRCL